MGRQLDRVPWGETAGFNLFAGYDRTNQLAIVVWTNLTLGIDDARANANQTILKVLDQIYTPSPLAPLPPRGTG